MVKLHEKADLTSVVGEEPKTQEEMEQDQHDDIPNHRRTLRMIQKHSEQMTKSSQKGTKNEHAQYQINKAKLFIS